MVLRFLLTAGGTLLAMWSYMTLELRMQSKGRLAGDVAAILLAVMAVRSNKLFTLAALVAGVAGLKTAGLDYLAFGGTSLLFLWTATGRLLGRAAKDDTHVDMSDWERTVRGYLWEHDRSQLHKVDEWLSKYRGCEDQLMAKLRAKYEVDLTAESSSPRGSSPAGSPRPYSPPRTSGSAYSAGLSATYHNAGRDSRITSGEVPTWANGNNGTGGQGPYKGGPPGPYNRQPSSGPYASSNSGHSAQQPPYGGGYSGQTNGFAHHATPARGSSNGAVGGFGLRSRYGVEDSEPYGGQANTASPWHSHAAPAPPQESWGGGRASPVLSAKQRAQQDAEQQIQASIAKRLQELKNRHNSG